MAQILPIPPGRGGLAFNHGNRTIPRRGLAGPFQMPEHPLRFAGDSFDISGAISHRANNITRSLIRSTSLLAKEYGAVNLGQGTPDGSPPFTMVWAMFKALLKGKHQYTESYGIPELKQAIAEKMEAHTGLKIDPDKELIVTHGATQAMETVMKTLINPGDEVVIFEPYYDNFPPDVMMAGGVPKFVRLKAPNWTFDPKELHDAFTDKTKAIIINSPNNPSGKVFTRDELDVIAKEIKTHGKAVAVTDDTYEHILYDGRKHTPIASLPGMRERTVIISSLSKSFNATGSRIGYIIAPRVLTDKIRGMHDYTVLCPNTVYQYGAVAAMKVPPSYYKNLADSYARRRETMMEILTQAGFNPTRPEGSYFILCDIRPLCKKYGFTGDKDFTDFLIKKVGVAVIPGSTFFADKEYGKNFVRVSYCKKPKTLLEAGKRLLKLDEIARRRNKSELVSA